jgi:hypothetical protein
VIIVVGGLLDLSSLCFEGTSDLASAVGARLKDVMSGECTLIIVEKDQVDFSLLIRTGYSTP